MRIFTSFFLLALLFSSFALGQKVSPPLPEMDWQVHSVGSSVSYAYNEFGYSLEKGIVYTSEADAVAAVRYKKEFSLIKVNNKGQVLWNTPIPGYILGVSKFNGNVLVLYSTDWDQRNVSRMIRQATVAIFDIRSGSKLKEEIIPTNSSTYTEAKLVTKPSGEFNCILVRQTPYNGNYSETRSELIATTLKMSVLEFGNDLKISKETDIKSFNDAAFLGCIANENGDLFIAAVNDEKIRVEKFNSLGVSQQKLEGSIYRSKHAYLEPVMSLDLVNNQSVLIGIHFRNQEKQMANQLWNFQFDNGKVSTSPDEALTKDFAKGLEPVNKNKKGIDHTYIGSLQTVGIVGLNDKIIVLKQIRYMYFTGSTTARYRSDAVVISFYDKQGKLLKNLCIDKDYETFNGIGSSLGYKLMNNKLYILTGANGDIGRYENLLYTINCDQMSVESFGVLDRAKLNPEFSVEAASSFWFGNIVWLNQVRSKGTVLQKLEL